jgi:hypothetical protein
LLQRARDSLSTVRFKFRCDAPAERRLLEMEIIPRADGSIEFQTNLITTQPRDEVSLLDRRSGRSDLLLKICGWCMRVQVNDSWLTIEDAITELRLFEAPRLPNVTHGMCPECYEGMLATLEAPAAQGTIS